LFSEGIGKAGPRCRILIADDTPDIRYLLRQALERDTRFEVIGEAGDGVEVLEMLGTMKPHAILLDLAMPVMDGLEAIPEIRRTAPDTKIVVLSGFDAAAMSQEAMARGAHAYLEKGASLTEITALLAGFCPKN
jgi:DNA-binding NarL/FixJ family response regulator